MSLNINILYLPLLFLAGIGAQSWANPNEKFLGVVEIPKIFGTVNKDGPPGQSPPQKGSPIKLHVDPDSDSTVVVQVMSPDEIDSREHGYEEYSATVYGRKDGWFKIKAKGGTGWLAPQDSGPFRPYEELFGNLGFLNKNWNGRLYASPGEIENFDQMSFKEEAESNDPSWMIKRADVSILEKKRVEGTLWVQVQIFKGGCGEPVVLGKKGWVKAHNEKGKEAIWFRSRGC